MDHPKTTLRDSDLLNVGAALRRSAADALRIARQTGTPCYVWEDGRIVDIGAESVAAQKSRALRAALAIPNYRIYINSSMSHDPAKRRKNLDKHRVDLPSCMDAFDFPMLTREDDREDYGELRLVSLGWAHGRLVVLV